MFPLVVVRGLVRHFCDLAGYEGVHVLVTFDKRKFDRACTRYRLTPADADDYGESIVDVPIALAWINVPENKSWARLVRTAAHESLHIARPELRHGRVFEKSVTRMTRGVEP